MTSRQEPIEWQRRAWKVWPEAWWIKGDGPYAFVAPCKGVTTVTLWPTEALALDTKAFVDRTFCCGPCYPGLHYIRDLRKIRRAWLPDKPANTTTVCKKVKQGKCCVPYCRRDADYRLEANESYLQILADNFTYGKCPLICERHADDYGLFNDPEPPAEDVVALPLDSSGKGGAR